MRLRHPMLAVGCCLLMWRGAAAGWDYLSWVDVVPETRWEIADLRNEGLVDSHEAQALLLLADDPVDLTLAPAEVFRATAGIWFGEAEAVVRATEDTGWFGSLAEVAQGTELTPPELRRLKLLAREPLWEPAALIQPRAVAIDGRLEVEVDPEGHADPAGSLRGRADVLGAYRIAFLAVEDEEDGRVLRKYCLGAEPREGMLKRAVVGTFRASFGEGLVLNNYRRGAHGVFYDTIKERRYRGVAATSSAGGAEWTVLYSRERPRGGAAEEKVWGANLHGLVGPSWRLGATYCRTDNGDTAVDNFGLYWRGRAGGWHVAGEAAGTGGGDVGLYSEAQHTGDAVKVRASVRHYGKDFESPQGNPYADADGTPDARNETGFYVEGKTGARSWYAARWSCDVWGTASLDNLNVEAAVEGVVWRHGWEVSGRAAHRQDDLPGSGSRTALSSRVRWESAGTIGQVYGRMEEPGGTGYVEVLGVLGLADAVGVGVRGKIDLGRKVGGTSWQELFLTSQLRDRIRARVAHRLGWERQAADHHTKWQILRAEVSVAL